ncbi:hypothetical protein [Hymenobacter chitinivorans]|uniref:Uncharacterized protein n=1 Tax=Hymenobacter chitinivorans DSM 11115 TaxID=1121954 RepID=A0A2M9BR49_9BACT|nr:hypothetical protein [Hymenobacter chitinivorans]PJJ60415.1 hypothetical protein CLV45_1841 [Hymenobacter chitinivorans DSM 11115]
MPKTIDYPRTSYLSAWEIAEVVDDTGGKCAIETCARKLNRKVSGSFKAIIGSAVKFGLVTSKRELLTTTNLFRRIKHAYDKQEEKVFHREAFLHPPLFTQICRKFRNRELPVHMFDVMLIREFGVEEINAQVVAKAFVDGARMVGVMDERNVVADIDQLAAQQTPRRELASTELPQNLFRAPTTATTASAATSSITTGSAAGIKPNTGFVPPAAPARTQDAVSSLFGLDTDDLESEHHSPDTSYPAEAYAGPQTVFPASAASSAAIAPLPEVPAGGESVHHPGRGTELTTQAAATGAAAGGAEGYFIHISGPGIDTQLNIQDVDDLQIVSILLEKVRKQLSR